MTPGRPARPSAPATAGYSGTPLYRKLGVKPGSRVLALGVPPGFPLDLLDADGTAEVDAHPDGPTGGDPAQVVLAFCPDAATLCEVLPTAMAATAEPGGRCWIAWPKRAARVATDLSENVVRDAALALGWVDVKVCAVDPLWSGLCLMRRTRSRAS